MISLKCLLVKSVHILPILISKMLVSSSNTPLSIEKNFREVFPIFDIGRKEEIKVPSRDHVSYSWYMT